MNNHHKIKNPWKVNNKYKILQTVKSIKVKFYNISNKKKNLK